jgi:hypothetical protein
MTVRRIDAGPLLALLGALLLLVSLFLHWYHPGITGWDVFELVDVLLAGLAITVVLAVLALAGIGASGPDPRWVPWAAGAALVLVLVTLLDRPPASGRGDLDVGAWLALAGAAGMALGALLSVARISVSLNVQGRQRVAAVDARPTEPAGPTDPADDPTKKLP